MPQTKAGALSQSKSLQGFVSDKQRNKKATHKYSRAEGPAKVQGPVSNQTVLVATDNSTVVA